MMFKLYFIFFIFSLLISTWQVFATEPYTGIICTNKKQTTKLEFFFKEKGQGFTKVYKRIEGQFVEVGQVVGHKAGSLLYGKTKMHIKALTLPGI